MKTTLLKLTVLIIATFSLTNMFGQQLGTTGLYKHGTNSASAGAAVASEATDSVTVGAVMVYYVAPDPLISPLYNFTVSPTADLNSTFGWVATPNTGVSINAVGGFSTNYKSIVWPGTPALIGLDVVETATAGTCPGSTTNIPVRVIAKPTVTGGAAPAAQCSSTPVVTFSVPLSMTTSVATPTALTINYTVYNPDNTVFKAASDLKLASGATSFNLTLTGATQYGAYKVTINTVNDHISLKSAVQGVVTTPDILLTVNRVPSTGPIYHVPNI